MTTAAKIIAQKPAVLLDFDGPVCAVLNKDIDRHIAKDLLTCLQGEIPETVRDSSDPFLVLDYASVLAPQVAMSVEHRFRELEIEAVRVAVATPGAEELLKYLHQDGMAPVIVSNNSFAAVETYLAELALRGTSVASVPATTRTPTAGNRAPFSCKKQQAWLAARSRTA